MVATKSWLRTCLVLAVAVLPATAFLGCSATSEAKETKFLESGKKYLESKDYGRAIIQFRNAARAKPADPEPYYQLALAYLEAEDPRAGIAHLKKASELDPRHVGAQLKLAELMAFDRSVDIIREAEERAKTVLAASPENVDALSTLAFAEMRLGRAEDAEQHLLRALDRFPQHLKSSLTLASLKLTRKDWKAAEEVLKAAVAQAPQSPEPVVALGRFYVMMKNPAEAEIQFRRALQIDPRDGPALMDLGSLQSSTGHKEQARETYKQLSALPEKQFKPVYGIFLLQEGQYDAAIAEFERLAKESPKDRSARTRLVAAYVAARRVADAEKVLTRTLEKNSKDVEALLQRGEIHIMTGNLSQAQNDLTQVLRFKPDSAEAHHLLAKIHGRRGEALNERQKLAEALRLDPNLLAARLDLARALLAGRGAKPALDLLNQTPEAQRRTLPVIIQRNWVLLALREYGELRQGIDEGMALASAPDLLLQDALLKIEQKDFTGGRSCLEGLLQQNPEDLRALEALARSYVAQQRPELALEKLKEHASRRPQSAPLQHTLGRWLLASGRLADAREAFTRSKEADPVFTPAHLALAEIDMMEGKLDAARGNLSGLLSSGTDNTAVRTMAALVEERAANYGAAIDHYRKAVEKDPKNLLALNNLAYRLANDGNQPDEALRYAQQAKELAPDNPSVDDTIGWAFYHRGIYRTAVTYLENADLRADKALVKYHLAMAYTRAGDQEKARQTLDSALKTDPNLPEAKAARELLNESPKVQP